MEPIDVVDYTKPISVFHILFLFFLNFILERFFPGLLYIFILSAAFLFCLWNSWVAQRNIITPSVRRNDHEEHLCCTKIVGMPVNDKRADQVKLSIEDVKTMMEVLDYELNNNMDSDSDNLELEGMFEEEVSLGEIKEAFDLFDENGDGFIDAKDLKKVLCGLGLITVGSDIDECKSMISGFDNDGDGRLNFEEFAKLVEQSFC